MFHLFSRLICTEYKWRKLQRRWSRRKAKLVELLWSVLLCEGDAGIHVGTVGLMWCHVTVQKVADG